MKKCKSCKSEIDAKATKCPHCKTDQRNWFRRHPILTALLVLFVIGIIGSSAGGTKTSTTSNNSSRSQTNAQADQPTTTPRPAVREVSGTAITLGAGTFIGGKDVAVGLYDVTAPGQSGNFIVSGADSYNDILGQGVTTIRAQISNDDQIKLSGLSSVTLTPVSTPFVTTHTLATLYGGNIYSRSRSWSVKIRCNYDGG